MDKLVNLSFETNDDGVKVFFIGDKTTEIEEDLDGTKLKYDIRERAVNNSNMLKIKALYPNITEKENQYKSLYVEFKEPTTLYFLKEFINKINIFLYRTLERMHDLYWKKTTADNYIQSQYNLDEVIRMALDPSEKELDLLLKVYDMKNPFKYQQVKIDENIEEQITDRREKLGKNVIKNYQGKKTKNKKN